jgi:hypothetical protein
VAISILACSLPSAFNIFPKVEVEHKVTLQLAVYRQSVRPGVRPIEANNERFFSN